MNGAHLTLITSWRDWELDPYEADFDYSPVPFVLGRFVLAQSQLAEEVRLESRDDESGWRWRVGLSQLFQVSNDFGIILQLQRDIVSSNIPLYAYTSNSFLVGPQIRF